MRPSLQRGKLLPESYDDFLTLVVNGQATYTHCRMQTCRRAFGPSNTHTPRGWAETQISSMCEDCFDDLFKEGGSGR
jgi:hypothetical protein